MPLPSPARQGLPDGQSPQHHDIFVAEKIIADISSGVYRSPAAAIKELISNAYDADATKVTITTDPPRFRTLTVEDNGSGMDIQQFLHVVSHIGGSQKRVLYHVSPERKRKLIGRIGIGMLAVAQLGTKFFVSSTVKGSPDKFIAEVNLEPFHKDDAALMSMQEKEGKINIGAVQYVDKIPEDPKLHYTVITVPDAKKGLTSEITGLVKKALGAKDVVGVGDSRIRYFYDLAKIVQSSNRADLTIDGYFFLLWELGLLSPVRYLAEGPFTEEIRTVEGLDSFQRPEMDDFSVVVDGIEIFRPQLFPNAVAKDYPSPDPKIYPLEFDGKVAGRQLKFSGYIYVQQPRIQPEELKGVHIRIRHVGIGRYDKTWLGYPFDEGIKFGQVSGEVFVDEGLEPALNIDRDSFRETDVHFQAMKAYIWEVLQKNVFPEFKSRQKEFRVRKEADYSAAASAAFLEYIDLLPAPLIGEPSFVDSRRTFLDTLRESKRGLKIQRSNWAALVKEFKLTKEAQQRLIQVLTVLVSAEMLSDLTEDEFAPLLNSLAIAVQ